jgi:ubiquitin
MMRYWVVCRYLLGVEEPPRYSGFCVNRNYQSAEDKPKLNKDSARAMEAGFEGCIQGVARDRSVSFKAKPPG